MRYSWLSNFGFCGRVADFETAANAPSEKRNVLPVASVTGEEAAERRFERGDTAYSPRFREEKPSAAVDELRFRPLCRVFRIDGG